MNKGDTGWTKSSASAIKGDGGGINDYTLSHSASWIFRDIWNGPDLIISLISDRCPAVKQREASAPPDTLDSRNPPPLCADVVESFTNVCRGRREGRIGRGSFAPLYLWRIFARTRQLCELAAGGSFRIDRGPAAFSGRAGPQRRRKGSGRKPAHGGRKFSFLHASVCVLIVLPHCWEFSSFSFIVRLSADPHLCVTVGTKLRRVSNFQEADRGEIGRHCQLFVSIPARIKQSALRRGIY